ncbi:ISAs1 family transposase [Streptomyces olivochromogenes]|uniref:ISAs1 family transposase n=1 Tax=Streptomyces olivochromogenes TaxID=1963 RepID=A0A250VP46_STROL|nr:ISAs1 family transposase [Streptomyces olivochromogenes]
MAQCPRARSARSAGVAWWAVRLATTWTRSSDTIPVRTVRRRRKNREHHRDVTVGEDASRVRTDSAPRTMDSLRNLAVGVLRLAGRDNIAEGLRHHGRDMTRPMATLGPT